MPFDGLVTSALTYQLNEDLRGGKIEKIYQPLKDELFIQINSNHKKHILFISSNSGNPRIYLTDEKSQNPTNPSSFCMLLRKHLIGGRIVDVTQYQSDRVIEFQIISSNELSVKEPKKLIVEIMGKHSNVILVDGQTENVLDSIKHVSFDMSRERQILPKIPYTYPPEKGKLSFYNVSQADFDINNIQGISKVARNEILESPSPYDKLKQMADRLKTGDISPVIYYDDQGKPIEFYALPLAEYSGAKSKAFDSVSQMLNYYYSQKDSSNRMNQKSADLLKTLNQNISKLNLKKQKLLEDLEKAKKGHLHKLYGELLTANLHNIKDGEKSAVVTDYYKNQKVEIQLDPMMSVSENAQRYYKKYNKSKTALEEKSKQLNETQQTIDLLDSYLTYIENAETPEDVDDIREELIALGYLKKRKNQPASKNKKTGFLRFRLDDRFDIYVGRNNRENDKLTMKKAGSNDIWFHTKDIPGSHVILFTNNQTPSEADILESASIAAYYSKGRQSQNVPVDYTKVKYVKKPSGAKPGMVIFTDNKTVYVNPKKPKED